MSLSTGAKKSSLFTTPLYNFNYLPAPQIGCIAIAGNSIVRLQGSGGNSAHSIVERSEHGRKTQQAAQAQGCFSQGHAIGSAAEFCCCKRDVGTAYSYFSCDAAPWHGTVVSVFLQQVWQWGATYLGSQRSDAASRQTIFRRRIWSTGKCCAALADHETKPHDGGGGRAGTSQDRVVPVGQGGINAVRYCFLQEIEFGKDGDVSEPCFINPCNAGLVNLLRGSLIRTLKTAAGYCGGASPNGREAIIISFLVSKGLPLAKEDNAARENLQFSQVCKIVLSLIGTRDEFLDGQTSWCLRQQGKRVVIEAVCHAVLKAMWLAASWLFSSLSSAPRNVCRRLGMEVNLHCRYGGAAPVDWGQAQGVG